MECKKKVDRIVEEFRRFKVKFEIARKQKDVESKHNFSRGATPMSPSLERTLNDLTSGTDDLDEIQRLQALSAKWKSAYEKVVKENELLRNRGSESLLATQWRERYESSLKDRDEINEKLKVYMKHHDGSSSGKSIEQAYLDVKEEYKEFRKRFLAIQEQRESELEELRQRGVVLRGGSSLSLSGSNEVANIDTLASSGLQQSKMLYIKQMVFQYLICKDAEVKLHVESALIAIFRFSAAEKNAIVDTRKAEDVDTLTSITTFLGSFAGSSV